MGCGASSRKVYAEVEEVCTISNGEPRDLLYWQIPIPPEPPKLPTPRAANGNSAGSQPKRNLTVDTDFDESVSSSAHPSSTDDAPTGQTAAASSQQAPPTVANDKPTAGASKVLKPVTSVADLQSLSVSELKGHLNRLKVQIPKGIMDKKELRQLFLEYVPWVDGSQTLKRSKQASSAPDLPIPEHCTREAFLQLSVPNLKKWVNHYHIQGTYVDKLALVDALFDVAGPSLRSAFPVASSYKKEAQRKGISDAQ